MDDLTTDDNRPSLIARLSQAGRFPSSLAEDATEPVDLRSPAVPGVFRIFAVGVMIIGATVSLVLGLTLPVIELTYFYVWSDTHSFVSIVRALYAEQELFLAGILVVFSILFPVLKLLYLLVAYATMAADGRARQRMLNRMSWLGKWSMLDVLVLALVIFYVKASALTEAAALPGIYFFCAAVLMTMIAYALVEHSPGQRHE
ncbi:paraquat-inducible protein A [Dichotomicrobium thermohalophilum]|uniref:Paraquat-inducible protein A n=1 Tax=Dichotomicrobium thermohalophilum TaxID=933063 RepID=A0A397Q1Q7_9HYPH|nr:paraquat-inducible protein A [Dichotomicrobium thermohalophilum]RIA55102.1 paraquat-inducible protein A [Dichotomicrobium thermohalophilum]